MNTSGQKGELFIPWVSLKGSSRRCTDIFPELDSQLQYRHTMNGFGKVRTFITDYYLKRRFDFQFRIVGEPRKNGSDGESMALPIVDKLGNRAVLLTNTFHYAPKRKEFVYALFNSFFLRQREDKYIKIFYDQSMIYEENLGEYKTYLFTPKFTLSVIPKNIDAFYPSIDALIRVENINSKTPTQVIYNIDLIQEGEFYGTLTMDKGFKELVAGKYLMYDMRLKVSYMKSESLIVNDFTLNLGSFWKEW